MAKQTASKNQNRRWTAPARPLGMTPAIIAGVGLAAMLLCALAQTWLNDPGAVPAFAAATGGLRISEVMTSESAASGELACDWIELENASGQTVDLTGFALMRESKPAQSFAFPGGTLAPGEFAVVICDDSGQSVINGSYHAPFKLPASGEAVALLDKRGAGVDLVEIPALAKDQVYCRDAGGAWQISDTATPGAANAVERMDSPTLAEVTLVDGPLELSEVMAKNATFFPDENGEYPDYIEIHNTSRSPVSLAGWSLSDDRARLERWQFPAITLPADGYLAVHCSGSDRRDDPAHLHAPFQLSREGEDIYLTNPDGAAVSHVKVPAMEADQAYTLLRDGWTSACAPSPNQPNNAYGTDLAAEAIRARNTRGVLITEVMASSSSADDWIELYNSGAEAVDLTGCGLSDNAARPRKWQFPAGTVIQPGAYLGVFANGMDAVEGNRVQTNFALNVAGGYSVVLSEPDGTVFDRLYVPEQYAEISYGRVNGQQSVRYFTEATPGAANAARAYEGRTDAVRFSQRPGARSEAYLTLELSCEVGARIYYTTDASEPTSASTPYSGPIEISGNTLVRAIAMQENRIPSEITAGSYILNASHAMRMVCVYGDHNTLDGSSGVLNTGAKGARGSGQGVYAEVYDPDGTRLISQSCQLHISGHDSRVSFAQKGFTIKAQKAYGPAKFEAELFSNRDYGEYNALFMRASGQDCLQTHMRDSILASLAADTELYYQETEVCVVYVNGRYWGVYNMREHVDRHSLAQFEGWDNPDDVTLLDGKSTSGNKGLGKVISWVKANSLADDANVETLRQAIDIENYLDYVAMEMYTCNQDLNNVRIYRNANADGLWRWVLFDLDLSYQIDRNNVKDWLENDEAGTITTQNCVIFHELMKNAAMRDYFLTRIGQLLAGPLSAENVTAKIQARYELLKPEMSANCARWDWSTSTWTKYGKRMVSYAQQRPAKLAGYLAEAFRLSDAQKQQYFGDVK